MDRRRDAAATPGAEPETAPGAFFIREANRVTAKVRRNEKQAATGANGTLVKDPKTGEYRLAKD